MSHDLVQKRYVISAFPTTVASGATAAGKVDFNALGDKFTLERPHPIDIYKFGVITDDAWDPDAGGFALALDLRPTSGSDTARVEKDQLRRADAQLVAAGRVVYREVVIPVAESSVAGLGGDFDKVNVGPAGPLHVRPGEQVVLEVTNAMGAAATGYVWIEYAELGFAIDNTVVGGDGEKVIKDVT